MQPYQDLAKVNTGNQVHNQEGPADKIDVMLYTIYRKIQIAGSGAQPRMHNFYRAIVVAGAMLTTTDFVGATEPSSPQSVHDIQDIESTIMAGLAPVKFPLAPPKLSPDCASKRMAGDSFRRPLRGLRTALKQKRAPKVLAIGSSSTVGVGASRPSNAYIARLETDLEKNFIGLDFDVAGRGMSGEVAEGQAARMKDTVAETKPDLVLWQVGTNDALRHVDIVSFKQCLRRTLAWLAENKFDVVLVDPQYSDKLAKDSYYEQIVAAVADVAREQRVLLVDRFEAMRELSRQRGDTFYITPDDLHLNDNGHRCMAEQLARSIVAGVLLAEADITNPQSTAVPAN